ncbi:signal transduction histidine kinase [Rhodobium orientis]|uniref:histidine kinase n=1 Tax=Rhodobium orientis TaxID=34017 RepID=A0A327JL77_9HYPH|nr:HAMP domain-containing sensor histidine kinase [Rhodobium orientis]MBB4301327.1 signal transduction histidine kinase [Rhodobium orientis]MBK5951085.1 ATP-binding protein [Rhodobium orientis]RAI26851.1 ATP-binding protein [Rhodobium orientis]
MRRLSLRLRLVLAGAVAVVVALALAAAGLVALFGTHVERRAMAELSVQLDQVLSGLALRDGALVLATPPADPRFSKPYAGLYWQISADGRLLRSRSLWDAELPLPQDDLADGQVHRHDLAGPSGETLLTLERSVTLPARLGGGPARAAVAMDARELEAAEQAFLADIIPYLALLALVLIAAGWVQMAVGLRPLASLGRRVTELRSGAARRMGADWPLEVRPLAGEIDALLDAREADLARARARAGDLAHGLKTPLQALLGEAERLRARGEIEAAEDIDQVVRSMQRHVERELVRARAAAHAFKARADVAKAVERIVAVLRRTPDGGRLDWRIDVAPGLAVALDEGDFSEALGALAENAARFAAGVVAIEAVVDGDMVRLSLCDDGPGIPQARLQEMTARGRRLDEAGGGSGLGLAIASEIAEAAGGGLTLVNSSPGLEARLVMPRVLD